MKITQTSVASLKPRERKWSVWDEKLRGFGVRVNADGTKSYIAKFRLDGKQRKVTIGSTELIKAEDARRRAMKILVEASDGIDSAKEKRLKRQAPTISDLAAKFRTDYIPHHLKPSTQADYCRSIDKFILPALGSEKVPDIRREDIADFHQSMSGTPYQANRILGTLSVMLTQAEIWGMRPETQNPCLRVKRFKEHKRERYLSSEEMHRLADALDEEAKTAPHNRCCLQAIDTDRLPPW